MTLEQIYQIADDIGRDRMWGISAAHIHAFARAIVAQARAEMIAEMRPVINIESRVTEAYGGRTLGMVLVEYEPREGDQLAVIPKS